MSAEPARRIAAVLDVGTNTVLYLLAGRGGRGGLKVLDEDIVPTRLGEGFMAGAPAAPAQERTLTALAGLAARSRAAGATDLIVVGTEVLRRGGWRRDFLAAARARLGVAVEILSPQAEGALALLAARRSLALGPGSLVVVDVGGGSAQIARETRRGSPPAVASYAIGCVVVSEKFMAPGDAAAYARARAYVAGEIAALKPAPGKVVVAGGTAATLAALEQGLKVYDAVRVHGFALDVAAVAKWAEQVYALTVVDREQLAGMPPGRADIFPAGALVIAEIMRVLETREAVVSARGVRFGVAHRFFDGLAT